MKWVKYYSLLIFMYVFQTVLVNSIRVFGILPDPVFVLSVYVALKENRLGALVFGLVSGLSKDFSLMQTFGINALITLYTVFLISVFKDKYFYPTIFVNAIFVFVSGILYQSLYFYTQFTMWGLGDFSYSFLYVILPHCLYNTILSFAVYVFCGFMTGDKFFQSKSIWRRFK